MPQAYKVQDNRKRICRKCGSKIVKGDWAKGIVKHDTAERRSWEVTRRNYLCSQCFTDAHGEPILE